MSALVHKLDGTTIEYPTVKKAFEAYPGGTTQARVVHRITSDLGTWTYGTLPHGKEGE